MAINSFADLERQASNVRAKILVGSEISSEELSLLYRMASQSGRLADQHSYLQAKRLVKQDAPNAEQDDKSQEGKTAPTADELEAAKTELEAAMDKAKSGSLNDILRYSNAKSRMMELTSGQDGDV